MKQFAVVLLSICAVLSAVTFSSERRAPRNVEEHVTSLPKSFGPLHPRISPQGDRIAFSYQGAIWAVARDGGAMKRLASGGGFHIEPTWSADGKRIAFIAGQNFLGGPVHVIDAEDGSPIEIPGTGDRRLQAQGKLHFHPDGRLLGNFVSGQSAALAWLDVKSGALTQLFGPPQALRRIALSADGKWIAYATQRDAPGQQTGNDGPQAELWRMPSSGGEPEPITELPSRVYDLCWASDGRSLFVSSDIGGAHYDLWHIPLNDAARSTTKLTFGQADEDRPSVSHDGRWLIYTDNRAGCTALVMRHLGSGDESPVAITSLDFGKPTGSLRIESVDAASGEQTVARVSLRGAGGDFHAPVGALYRIERNNGHFYCRGEAQLTLPAGEYEVVAYRGPEFRPSKHTVQVHAGKTTSLKVPLERWIDMAARGWYSGENHIHANYGYGEWFNSPRSMLDQCEGEALNVCNFMVANSDGDGVFDRSYFRGMPDPLSTPQTILYWNEEFRSTIWGHMTLVNLRQLVEPIFTGFQSTTNPHDVPTNTDIARRAHLQNALVNYTHAAQNQADPYLGAYTAKGLPVDAALGAIDSIDLNNSYAATVSLWYRLLNCGMRISASAGTDCFLNRVRSRLPGSDRAYVSTRGPLTYKNWIEGLRAGRSFVTNGPMLSLSVANQSLGDTIESDSPRQVSVVAKAESQFPLNRVELIYNGELAAKAEIASDGLSAELLGEVKINRSGWIALVASGPAHPDNPSGTSYAHTSPIYVTVRDRPNDARADAQFLLAWIDRLEAAVFERGRIPSPELEAHLREQVHAARAVYQKLLDAASQ